ncbi:hypothetical protein F3Y22_tig00110482pilonHSYRG00765 [Hibiscus syriacus]|uniref:Uncharacterized protein n=1 Tax=Hibiscus syriacus TaxID=106335 RepID=A0A6A3AIT2_HIBSY|nr:hypothetical protein F3Y22_tig00110482pilonHSYRG00765 [Hibiscus syriacus]
MLKSSSPPFKILNRTWTPEEGSHVSTRHLCAWGRFEISWAIDRSDPVQETLMIARQLDPALLNMFENCSRVWRGQYSIDLQFDPIIEALGLQDAPLGRPPHPPAVPLVGLIGSCSKPYQKKVTRTDVDVNEARLCLSNHVQEFMLHLLKEDENVEQGIPVITYDPEGNHYITKSSSKQSSSKKKNIPKAKTFQETMEKDCDANKSKAVEAKNQVFIAGQDKQGEEPMGKKTTPLGGHGGKGRNGWKGMPGANLQVSKLSSCGDPNCYRKGSGEIHSVGRRSSCLPSDLLGRHVFPASYKRLHVPCTSQHAGHLRPSERVMRGHPRVTERAMRGNPSEGRSPGVHGDLQGRPEGLATYVLGRACAMQHVHSLCLSKGRSPGVHGDLQGRQECMATYKVARSDTLGSFVYVPCEVIKQHMQVQGLGNSWNSAIMNDQLRMKSGEQMYGYYTGMFQVGCSIWKEQGLKGLYSQGRRFLVSRYYKRLKRAALVAQCAWRAKLARRELRKLKMAAQKPNPCYRPTGKQVEELTWQLQKLQREKENWGTNKTFGQVPVTQGVTVVDNETMNKLTAENEQLKAQVATLEQICEVRLKQATEAEMRIIDLKTAMQSLYLLTEKTRFQTWKPRIRF